MSAFGTPRSYRLREGAANALFVMAAEPEYGPALRARIDPLMTGVGPVEAAAATAQALAAHGNIDLIVNLGSAGSRVLDQGGIYQVATASYRDMDASPLGFPKGVTPFLDALPDLQLLMPLPDVPTARLSTGGNIVTGSAYDGVPAEMVDMETYAVVRAAARFSVPVIGLRGISDGREPLARYEDWTALLVHLDEALAAAVDGLETALADTTLPRRS